MARSIKKGPYVSVKLENKVLSINEGKAKRTVLSRHGAVEPPSPRILLVTLSLCITGTNSSRCM